MLSLLMAGDPIICYDNIEVYFGNSNLCSILTEKSYTDRELGKNKTITVPTNAFFLANGNNLIFSGDLSTRALLCRLDPKIERPEERSFDRNLHDYVPNNRYWLAPRCLTILKAYIHAGSPKPEGIKQFGRFEEWSDLVRSAIVWVGMADPCASRKEIENADPIRYSLKILLQAWNGFYGPAEKTLKDVVSEIDKVSKDVVRDVYEVSNSDKEA